ncbi:WecB/TagA/CpsF family glycosyltransferase [Ureibacillus thermosphaericus]|jgi:N-acetylglucosaminyldiphosphoundecaprenol N-acetyl-beta-D-mannosaminyltransferase|uniref:N-acetylglucosaminyldiphosphoundecaprenol N-acetyl-beta-D-mannosaminyltransferase n=1 Tax=Ureibacillus thermosphaericus TaxID=51173 RepID=A0A840PV56_URETH|nr:WecB/TagA/CpsF family glycosyltransferase [Ureibacillus thermosphaericus]MBB5149827.1 N-acetylglucosaminyldiphosphoundecaprenol N-acetyl-beta-D-mannosaminyltransferase [Ureibacillus thermosphaericus]NKZ32830.1 WecB/TagA/CpsF family glycosyltransferase [Ureibacillus thermosphaericus]
MKETVLGIQVNTENYDELIEQIFQRIERKEKSLIVAINPEKIMKAKEDPALKKLLNEAEFQIPDGIGVILASKIQKGQISERVTGVDLMMRLCEEAATKQKSIFLYGGKPGVAASAAEKLKELYPGIQIAGIQHGYETDNEKVISKINEAKPDILFVAMGSPKQENWINANRDQLYPTIYQGVGGSFDVLAGNVKRAPKAFQKVGLEWFYRLMMEPKRIKRQMALPKFLLEVVRNTKRN